MVNTSYIDLAKGKPDDRCRQPTAVHLGAADLPFVDIGDGSKLKVILVEAARDLWIIENVFQAGCEVQHRHTGPVYAYTTSGAWKYKEYRG